MWGYHAYRKGPHVVRFMLKHYFYDITYHDYNQPSILYVPLPHVKRQLGCSTTKTIAVDRGV